MSKITRYFFEAISSNVNKQIDFKNNKFITIEQEELIKGQIKADNGNALFQTNDDDTIDIIIALKPIKSLFLNGNKLNDKVEELTCLLYMPAKLNKKGMISKSDKRLPWLANEFLFPFIDEDLSVGYSGDYDDYLSDTDDIRAQIDNWDKYLKYTYLMYERVTQTPFDSLITSINHIHLDDNIYLFKDTTINATTNILNLYKDIIKTSISLPLYQKITQLSQEAPRPLIDNNDIKMMKNHCGQMNGDYPMSPSQRESLNHYNLLNNGEILAVNGPPGTGKTTLLQSLVADMVVKNALEETKAPVIVATSTNNQAVTNIIDSFGKINKKNIKNLEKHWISDISSFATYFPARPKEKQATKKNYQWSNVNGANFIEELDKNLNPHNTHTTNKYESYFIEQNNIYFNKKFPNITSCKDEIHRRLTTINKYKNFILDLLEELNNLPSKEELIQQINHNDSKMINYILRVEEWNRIYRNIPLLVRLLKMIPSNKRKIELILTQNMNDFELELFSDNLNLPIITEKYLEIIKNVKIKTKNLKETLKRIDELFNNIKELLNYFNNQGIILNIKEELDNISISKVNEILDTTVRYNMFWLSVHYYEARWLLKEDWPTDNQRGKTFENVLKLMYQRLALISPCLVMTTYMLPKNFKIFEGDNHYSFMYNFIDLLIVDEAGQISPEIGACAFALAKKAVVVGDTKQIPPVWNFGKKFDTNIALKSRLINNPQEFQIYEEAGLNCSTSSIMKIASNACPYNKFENGLFLSEHRRCYDEIINYCNELVYNGHLKPLRGSGKTKDNVIKNILPQMGYKQINTDHSTKVGTSRMNEKEAEEIANWLNKNYIEMIDKYKNEKKQNIIGIITPFKGQVTVIKKYIKDNCPGILEHVSVGTVHTFQGAERNIIIFSSVYGKKDGCYFINQSNSLMNVAVSRAKDSFLVFGDIECLDESNNSASGLLRKKLTEKIK